MNHLVSKGLIGFFLGGLIILVVTLITATVNPLLGGIIWSFPYTLVLVAALVPQESRRPLILSCAFMLIVSTLVLFLWGYLNISTFWVHLIIAFFTWVALGALIYWVVSKVPSWKQFFISPEPSGSLL